MKYYSNTWRPCVLPTFANTLIQDIPTINGSDSTQLEDWLVDIETAADLTDESRTKLA